MSADKYPEPTNRRRFVKGVVGGAALAGTGAAGAVTIDSTTNPTGRGGGTTEFYGVENTAGPAPRAMPQIVVEIDDEGFVKGLFPEVKEVTRGGETLQVAEQQIGDITYTNRWFQYCGVQTFPGVQSGSDQDNYFRYASEDQLPPGLSWQREDPNVNPGDRVNVEQFSDYEGWTNGVGEAGLGKPAKVTWRSQDLKPEETMVVELIRSNRIEQMQGESQWIGESTQQGFIAYLDKCTHFCCVPSFKGYPGSGKFGAQDAIYCPCHQSIYDPFQIVRSTYIALPRPEEG